MPTSPGIECSKRRGGCFEILAFTNLTNWDPLATFTNTTGTVEFIDASATYYLQRFYRARQVP